MIDRSVALKEKKTRLTERNQKHLFSVSVWTEQWSTSWLTGRCLFAQFWPGGVRLQPRGGIYAAKHECCARSRCIAWGAGHILA